MSEVNTIGAECPYCHYVNDIEWFLEDGVIEWDCEKCAREFDLCVETVVYYRTTAKADEAVTE